MSAKFSQFRLGIFVRALFALFVTLFLVSAALAQANSPWENAANVLQQAFTTTIARGLSLVAIVVSGLTFAFGEGGSKRVLAGVLFGVGMAIAAVNFLAWLFPEWRRSLRTVVHVPTEEYIVNALGFGLTIRAERGLFFAMCVGVGTSILSGLCGARHSCCCSQHLLAGPICRFCVAAGLSEIRT